MEPFFNFSPFPGTTFFFIPACLYDVRYGCLFDAAIIEVPRMTFRKVPTKTEGLNTTRRAGDFLADNARPCLSDRCPTFADSKDYLTAYRDAGNEKELRKRNGGTPSGTLTALPFQMEGRFIKTDRKHRFLPLRREKSRYASLT